MTSTPSAATADGNTHGWAARRAHPGPRLVPGNARARICIDAVAHGDARALDLPIIAYPHDVHGSLLNAGSRYDLSFHAHMKFALDIRVIALC